MKLIQAINAAWAKVPINAHLLRITCPEETEARKLDNILSERIEPHINRYMDGHMAASELVMLINREAEDPTLT